MPSDLSNYLATHYLTADPKPSSKKRKRKNKGGDADAGLLITDDNETGWTGGNNGGDDDEDEPMTLGSGSGNVAGTSAEFRKSKKSGWKVVSKAEEPSAATTTTTEDAAAADAILASAAAEKNAAATDADEGEGDGAPVMMSDGTHAGLQTAASVTAQLAARRAREEAEFAKQTKSGKAKEGETVYRDATGRRVDLEWKRAELRREQAEANQKKDDAEKALRGDVQEKEREKRREELRDAKVMDVARGVDDEEMNREMKDRVRWGDTMAGMIGSKDKGKGVAKGGGGASGRGAAAAAKSGRPSYNGAAAPNRYGIRPGYRWDGVDRGNGFEAERFKQINRRERNKGLEYSWQMDE